MVSENNIITIESLWKEFNDRIIEMNNDQYTMWKILNTKYEMLISSKKATDVQVEEFRHLTDKFKILV